MEQILDAILNDPWLHAQWLNTLSYMENCGARKIARAQHPTLVREEMLKHAAEEFRHAYHFKCQMERIPHAILEDYSSLLGGYASLHYLNALEVEACRLLKLNFNGAQLQHAAYLLVTYAIEKRAMVLYPLYDQMLRSRRSKVTVRSVLLEEKEHLQEIEEELERFPVIEAFCAAVCQLEEALFEGWQSAIREDLQS